MLGVEPRQAELARNHLSTSYNPRSFAANKIRKRATCLVFKSGNAVIAGLPGELAALNGCLEFTLLLQRMSMMPFEPTCRLENIVTNAYCFPINLDALAAAYPINTRYEVTRFPGLIFRFPHGLPFVFIIFPSGNIIGTGFSSWVAAYLAYLWLFCYVCVQFKDSKDASRESAAEKKNRAFNDDAVFAASARTLALVGFKQTYAAMLRREHEAAGQDASGIDWRAVWHELAAMPETAT